MFRAARRVSVTCRAGNTKNIGELPKLEKVASRAAENDIDERELLAKTPEYDDRHTQGSPSGAKPIACRQVLRVFDRFMRGAAIAIQANLSVSSIIVIDLAIDLLEFFSKLADMHCKLEIYLTPIAELSQSMPGLFNNARGVRRCLRRHTRSLSEGMDSL